MKTIEESFLDPGYMSIRSAAKFLGVSEQTLRRWEQEGKLAPVRHPVNKYRYYRRADLEPLRMEYQQAELALKTGPGIFQKAKAFIDGNPKLREPQQKAWVAVSEHFSRSADHAVLQVPVGCGKTGIIATLPFGNCEGKALVLVPNVTIRDGVAEKLDSGSKNFLRKSRVVDSLKDGPFAAVLDGPDANIHDCLNSDYVVVNIQQLASSADRWLPKFPPNFFSMILVDEGHHNVAPSWRKVFDRFPDAKVISLTATPFRGDGKRVAGTLIYRYPFTRAMLKGYVKQLHSCNLTPEEIYFTYRGEDRRHTLEEVLDLREEQWFSRGVALSLECNRHLVDASIEKMNKLRAGSTVKHQIIAAACSVDHARQIRGLYEERGLAAREIYSAMPEDEKEKVLGLLSDGRIDCIVQVQMLGEGFDHPPLSVAAVFRPFRSLSPFIQFIGRALRVVKENAPEDPDNRAYVVSHVGLNNDQHWEDFREFDLDDQAFFKRLLESKETAAGEEGEGEGAPRRFDVGMNVTHEILAGAVNAPFLDPDDDRVLDELMANMAATLKTVGLTPEQMGVTRDALREQLKAAQGKTLEAPSEEQPVSPQRDRQVARKRLNERAGSVAARVLQDLSCRGVGKSIGGKLKQYAGLENKEVVIRLLNDKITTHMGGQKRGDADAASLHSAYEALDRLGDEVRDEIKPKLKG